MATLLSMPNEATEAENRKAEAKKHFNAICKASAMGSTSSLRIGWHAFILKRDNLFGILGFSCERDVWEAAEVGDSTWYANLRLAEDFDGVDEEVFCHLKQANAKELAKLPSKKRLSKEWLEKAAKDPIKTFKTEIEDELDGRATEADTRERTVSYIVKMPKSRRKSVQAGLQEISKEYGCEGDESRTLELLVAEKTLTPSLVSVITGAVQKLKSIKDLCESGLSSDEVLARVIPMNEEMILDFAAALQNLESQE